MVFKSRISITLIVFITGIIGFVGYKYIIGGQYMGLVLLAALYTFTMAIMLGIKYVIDGTTLYVKEFIFFKGTAYDLTKLKSVNASRSIMSAPAASMKRIKLDFGVGEPLIISPREMDVFFDEIRKINPKVEINV